MNRLKPLQLFSGAATAGNVTAYWFGRKTGHLLDSRKDTRFFRRQCLVSAEHFYKKQGAVALAAGLFLPLIRTFVPTGMRWPFQQYGTRQKN